MATNEEQPQDVVAIMPVVELRSHARLGIVQVRERVVAGERLLLLAAAESVERRVLAYEDEPRRRVARWALRGPGLKRAQASLLKRFLRRTQLAEVTQQRADRVRPRAEEGRIDGGYLVHVAMLEG